MDISLKTQFKKKLAERLENPRIESSRLRRLPDCCKIKLRGSGYRLVYQVEDARLVVFVVAVGKRGKNQVYGVAEQRLSPKNS